MARMSMKARREAEFERRRNLPLAPEVPERLQGPEIGARVHHSSRFSQYDADATVVERSYVWAPDAVHTYPDGNEYRGHRRYDLKVVRFDSGNTLLVDDKDLVTL